MTGCRIRCLAQRNDARRVIARPVSRYDPVIVNGDSAFLRLRDDPCVGVPDVRINLDDLKRAWSSAYGGEHNRHCGSRVPRGDGVWYRIVCPVLKPETIRFAVAGHEELNKRIQIVLRLNSVRHVVLSTRQAPVDIATLEPRRQGEHGCMKPWAADGDVGNVSRELDFLKRRCDHKSTSRTLCSVAN